MVNVKKFLKENADFGYAEFNRKFISSKYPIVGVRLPTLKKFAKQFLEPEYIDLQAPDLVHEEILLYGFAAAGFKSEDEQLEYLENVLPHIDNWATCDCIVGAQNQLKGEKSFCFFKKLLLTPNADFYTRVGIVGMMKNFIKTPKVDEVVALLPQIASNGYYVKMAVAWFLAELCANDFARGKSAIKNTANTFIKNMAISKANQSSRITPDQKKQLCALKLNDKTRKTTNNVNKKNVNKNNKKLTKSN